jgi:Phosphoesterase family
LIQQRPIADSEYQFVNAVFQGTLPPEDQIVITSLSAPGDIPFTVPGADNKIYMNMGTGYANPINFYPNDSYPTLGQVFVHEMTHVWQIHQSKFLPGLVCKGIVTWADHQVGASVYQYGPPTTPWEQFGLEMQGAIVDQWFGGIPTVNAPNRDRMHAAALDDPYFGYIANNIRKGVD